MEGLKTLLEELLAATGKELKESRISFLYSVAILFEYAATGKELKETPYSSTKQNTLDMQQLGKN